MHLHPVLFALNNRSEEHTSELQSLTNLVCRLLLEKKKYRRRVYTRVRLDIASVISLTIITNENLDYQGRIRIVVVSNYASTYHSNLITQQIPLASQHYMLNLPATRTGNIDDIIQRR